MRWCYKSTLSPHRTDTWVIAADCDCQPRRAQRSRPASPESTTHHTTHRVLSRLVISFSSPQHLISHLIVSLASHVSSHISLISHNIAFVEWAVVGRGARAREPGPFGCMALPRLSNHAKVVDGSGAGDGVADGGSCVRRWRGGIGVDETCGWQRWITA